MAPDTPRHNLPSRRGIAMVLVMACVAAAVILGLAFLTTSSAGTVGAQTATDYYRARHIAESGLDMIVRYTDLNPDWRLSRTPGTWVSNYALDGGTFTATAGFTASLRDPLYVTVTARYGGAQHTLDARLVSTIHAYGGAVSDKIEVKRKSSVDAYDSTGLPDALNVSADARLATLATYAGAAQVIDTSTLHGEIWVGAGGSPGSVVTVGATSLLTGGAYALPQNFTIPAPPSLAADAGPNLGTVEYKGDTVTILNSNQQFNDLTIRERAQVRITGNVSIIVNKNFRTKDRAVLIIDPGSRLTVYVKERIEFSGSSRVNDSGDPQRLVVYGLGSGYEHVAKKHVRVCAIIDAVNSRLKVQKDPETGDLPEEGDDAITPAKFYGVFMGQSLKVEDSVMRVDRNPAIAAANPRLPVYASGTELRQVSER